MRSSAPRHDDGGESGRELDDAAQEVYKARAAEPQVTRQ